VGTTGSRRGKRISTSTDLERNREPGRRTDDADPALVVLVRPSSSLAQERSRGLDV
jgi:hypothetical protein